MVAGLLGLQPSTAGADALPDATFGTGSLAKHLLLSPNAANTVTATTVQPDGKTLILGQAMGPVTSTVPRATVVRLTTAGVLDTTFGVGGRAYLPDTYSDAGSSQTSAVAIAVAPNGRIVIAGSSGATAGGPRRPTVARLTTDGNLDSTFGGTGVVRFGQDGATANSVAVDSANRVVVVEDSSSVVPTVYRFTAAGVLDTTFATTGSVALRTTAGLAFRAVDVAALPADGVAVIGSTNENRSAPFLPYHHVVIQRLDGAGAVVRTTLIRPDDPVSTYYTYAKAASGAARPDGTVVATIDVTALEDVGGGGYGIAAGSTVSGAFLATEAPTTGAVGLYRIGAPVGINSTAGPVTVAADGSVAILYSFYGSQSLAAFTPTFAPDDGLAPGGTMYFDKYGQDSDRGRDLAFDPDRRLVIAGVSREQCCASWDFAAQRLTTLNAPPSGPPSAPRNLAVTTTGRTANFTWDLPTSDGGLPLTGISGKLYEGTALLTNIGFSEEATSYTTSLNYGREYRFVVYARNRNNDGAEASVERIVPLPITTTAFVDRTATDLTGKVLGSASRTNWINQLQTRTKTPFDYVLALRRTTDATTVVDPTARLYRASFNRIPDTAGLRYWIGRKRSGQTLVTLASFFAQSSEFQRLYGAQLDNRGYVTAIYRNVLGREPDAGGVTYWTNQLTARTRTRGQVMVQISESSENVRTQANTVDVQAAMLGLLGRTPTAAEQAAWLTKLTAATPAPITQVFSEMLQLPAYATRVTA